MKYKIILRIIYGVSFVFLLNSLRLDFITKDVWNGVVDLEFMGFLFYMIWIYPERKLKLNDDLMAFLLIYFSGYAIRNLLIQDWLKLGMSVVFIIGYGAYRLYLKQRKYRFYIRK